MGFDVTPLFRVPGGKRVLFNRESSKPTLLKTSTLIIIKLLIKTIRRYLKSIYRNISQRTMHVKHLLSESDFVTKFLSLQVLLLFFFSSSSPATLLIYTQCLPTNIHQILNKTISVLFHRNVCRKFLHCLCSIHTESLHVPTYARLRYTSTELFCL